MWEMKENEQNSTQSMCCSEVAGVFPNEEQGRCQIWIECSFDFSATRQQLLHHSLRDLMLREIQVWYVMIDKKKRRQQASSTVKLETTRKEREQTKLAEKSQKQGSECIMKTNKNKRRRKEQRFHPPGLTRILDKESLQYGAGFEHDSVPDGQQKKKKKKKKKNNH